MCVCVCVEAQVSLGYFTFYSGVDSAWTIWYGTPRSSRAPSLHWFIGGGGPHNKHGTGYRIGASRCTPRKHVASPLHHLSPWETSAAWWRCDRSSHERSFVQRDPAPGGVVWRTTSLHTGPENAATASRDPSRPGLCSVRNTPGWASPHCFKILLAPSCENE